MLNLFTNRLVAAAHRVLTYLCLRSFLFSFLLLAGCSGVPLAPSMPSLPGLGQSVERSEVSSTDLQRPQVSSANRSAFDEALTAMQNAQWSDAERLLRKVTTSQPELSGAWVNLGQVYVAQGNAEEARLALREAIAANPQNCIAHNQLGVMAREAGDFSSAEQHYTQCLQAQPAFQDAHLNLGILYELYLGRLSEALASYKQYQALAGAPDRKVAGWVMDLERRLGV